MRNALETLVAVLLLLIALYLLPENESVQWHQEKGVVDIQLAEVTECWAKWGQWQGHWQQMAGQWIDKGSEGESAAFSLLRELDTAIDLPRIEAPAVEEIKGFVRWKDSAIHEVSLGQRQLGGGIPFSVDGQWYLGTVEMTYRLETLMKTSP